MQKNYSQKDIASRLIYQILWDGYIKSSPEVQKIQDHYSSFHTPLLFDHLSFRSFNCKINGQSAGAKGFEKIFSILGYNFKEKYTFPASNISAYYYEHYSNTLPKLYISQAEILKFDDTTKKIVRNIAESATPVIDETAKELFAKLKILGVLNYEEANILLRKLSLFFELNRFSADTDTILKLYKASEYLAWVVLFGNFPHHFAFPIHESCPPGFETIEDTLNTLKSLEIETEPSVHSDGKDLFSKIVTQSSVQTIETKTTEAKIRYGNVEFVQRGIIKEQDGEPILYKGFLGKNVVKHDTKSFSEY